MNTYDAIYSTECEADCGYRQIIAASTKEANATFSAQIAAEGNHGAFGLKSIKLIRRYARNA